MLQFDWGGEYRPYTNFLSQNEIIFRHSYPYTHHQNELVERKHKHIVELRLILLAQAELPFTFWWDVVHTVVYHINRLSSIVLSFFTPYERLFNYKLDYNKCFGCACDPYLRDYNKHKFDYHSSKCIFIEYGLSYKGYKCMHSSERVYIVRFVIFFYKFSFPYSSDSVFNSKEFDPYSAQLFTSHQVYNLSVSLLPSNSSYNNSDLVSSTNSNANNSDNLNPANNSHSSSQINTSCT